MCVQTPRFLKQLNCCSESVVEDVNDDWDDEITIQSDAVDGVAELEEKTDTAVTQNENIEFTDEVSGATVDFSQPMERSFDEHIDDAASFAKYLQRPVIIDSFTWAESDTFSTSPRTIYPWKAYFNNSYIKNKLANFSRLHCQLKLTFRFNASPFYYGSMRACYDPLNSGKFDPVGVSDLVSLSQTPGVFIEPQESSSMEFILPFLYPDDWIDTSHANIFDNIGKIMFLLYVPLRSANGATGTGITVTTYCEAVDVKVCGPSNVTVLQSGIISGPASAIATAAGNYTSSAKVGPYAKAIKVGATLVSSVARMFGFSNAPSTIDVIPVQNKVYHAFANTETSMPIDKLAVDPKNEVVLDNRVAGVNPNDELEIKSIVTRPSYIGTVDWTSASAVNTRLLFGQVTPSIDVTSSITAATVHNMTPSAWVSYLFRFWRGSMKLHFKVVRSKYQKGRLMVNWDPNGSLNGSGFETALFTTVFDLSAPEQGFDFVIPYKAVTPWLQTTVATGFATSDPGYSKPNTNGNWQMLVVNPLSGPLANNTITIQVFASACEDMEFAAPRKLPYLTPQVVQSGKVDGPIDGSSISESTLLHQFTTGERILSLRALLHRTTFSLQQVMGASTTQIVANKGRVHTCNLYPRIPPEPGFTAVGRGLNVAGGGIVPATQKPVNLTKMHPIDWVLSSFVGYRGSVNVHANITCGGQVQNISNASITRIDHDYIVNSASKQTNSFVNNTPISASLATVAGLSYTGTATVQFLPQGAGGMVVTNGQTQMALSANIPQYCPARFYPAWLGHRDLDPGLGTTFDGFRVDADFNVLESSEDDSTVTPLLSLYYAAGVDFNTVFFTGVPKLYEYSIVIT